ncbi:MAG: sigma factor-like helix-turn-helix DNA-binding protein [Patescibacteria group bacterium]
MDNILEKMVKGEKSEELSRLNAISIVNNLFSDLLERERDILARRFGLSGVKGETLEKIGQMHKLTRERVRQIEAASIRKIKKLENLEEFLSSLRLIINQLLKEHGGMLRKDYLLDILTVYCLEVGKHEGDSVTEDKKAIYRNHFNFLISKLLEDGFDIVKDSDKFNAYYKEKGQDISNLEALANDLVAKVESVQKTLTTEDILDLIKKLNSYSEETVITTDTDLTTVFKSEAFADKAEIINGNKVLYSLLQAVKSVDQNKYGHWGKTDWQEIKPKTINDKIYLVLKNEGKPMHFTEIATKINEIKFDKKNANPATVHNELILDGRYILTGRGMYGLKDWEK